MRLTKLERLRALRQHCTMENFSSSLIHGETVIVGGKTYTPTEFIRESTRIFRETWILPTIDELIAEEADKRTKRRVRE